MSTITIDKTTYRTLYAWREAAIASPADARAIGSLAAEAAIVDWSRGSAICAGDRDISEVRRVALAACDLALAHDTWGSAACGSGDTAGECMMDMARTLLERAQAQADAASARSAMIGHAIRSAAHRLRGDLRQRVDSAAVEFEAHAKHLRAYVSAIGMICMIGRDNVSDMRIRLAGLHHGAGPAPSLSHDLCSALAQRGRMFLRAP
jgi:hypothetical protein